MSRFQTIGIIGKQDETPKGRATLDRLVNYLRSRGREVFFDKVSGALLDAPGRLLLAPA